MARRKTQTQAITVVPVLAATEHSEKAVEEIRVAANFHRNTAERLDEIADQIESLYSED